MLASVATLATFSIVGANPSTVVVDEFVDLIEVNHLYDEEGEHVLDQVIFYDWCDKSRRFQVRSWRLLKQTAQRPTKDWSRDEYVSVWQDGLVLRKVSSKTLRETWTQFDPEIIEREKLPVTQRRQLESSTGPFGYDRAGARPNQGRNATASSSRR